MAYKVRITGCGYKLGSKIVKNEALAISLGLSPDWFEVRTGIRERRICDPVAGENVITLAVGAIDAAIRDAGIDRTSLGSETVLIHIQNGFTYLTPPPPVLLCNELGIHQVRPLGIDGVCSEPINALEIGALMIEGGVCSRAIISASVDFLPLINGEDRDTAGLFGAGAGALILELSDGPSEILSSYWETDCKYWKLGTIPLLGYKQHAHGVEGTFGYYAMDGQQLARKAFGTIPRVVDITLRRANWRQSDVNFFVPHQPNAKMLGIGMAKMKVDPAIVARYCETLGNMGPASLLVSFAMSKERRDFDRGSNVLLLSFGLGFACAAAAIRF